MIHQNVRVIGCVLAFYLFVAVTPSFAVPVEGLVDPGADWASTLGGTATYTFTNLIGGSNASMTGLVLAFEGDVFSLASTAINPFSVSSGWSVATLGLGTYEFSLLGGTPIPAGSSLTFSADYKLLNSALSLNSWDQGAYWSQAFGVLYSGSPYLQSGGTVYNSGSPVSTPEPGSLLLLGVALSAIAVWKKKDGWMPNV